MLTCLAYAADTWREHKSRTRCSTCSIRSLGESWDCRCHRQVHMGIHRDTEVEGSCRLPVARGTSSTVAAGGTGRVSECAHARIDGGHPEKFRQSVLAAWTTPVPRHRSGWRDGSCKSKHWTLHLTLFCSVASSSRTTQRTAVELRFRRTASYA